MKKLKKICLIFMFLVPFASFATYPYCNCSTSYWTSQGTITISYSYATNNGSCTPGGGNVYNFGSAEIYFDGDYLGTVYFGPGNNSSINDFLSCQNML